MLKVGGTPEANGCFSDWSAKQMLTDLQAEDAALDALELRLFTDGPTPNTSQVWADFTEAAFGGYAAKTALTFEAVAWENGYASVVSLDPAPVFSCNATADNPNVIGWALTKQVDAATKLVYAELFDTPQPMSQAGNQIVIPPVVSLKAAS